MIVRGVDQVGVALSQVSQQGAQCGVVSGQCGQVHGAPPIFVQQAGVGPRPQQGLHHLHLVSDDGQVEGSLKRRQEVTWLRGLDGGKSSDQ